MRRRRRQRNPLLMRIIGISVLVHIIALPILAHYGAFKKIQEHYVEMTEVKLPPPPLPPEKKEVVKKADKPKAKNVAQKAKHGPANANRSRQANAHTTNAPHIAMANGAGGGGDFSAEQGNGRAGEIPKEAKTAAAAKPIEPMPQPTITQPKTEVTQPKEAPVAPELPKVAAVQPKPAPIPKQPVFTEAEPAIPADQEPQPVIPDDLRTVALDKTCVVACTVSVDGKPMDVKVSQSSGNDELDRLAMDAARRWKFKPATRDGEPVESVVNLHIEFQVS